MTTATIAGLLLAHVAARAEAAEAARIEARPGALVGIDARGQEAWIWRHKSLRSKEGFDPPAGPLEANGQVVYGVQADLLTVSRDGRILRRDRFPGRITALAADPKPGWIIVSLVASSDFPEDAPKDRLSARYRLGSPAPSGPRSDFDSWFGTMRDAWMSETDSMWRIPSAPGDEARAHAVQHASDGLRDPTNPYHQIQAALWFRAAGDSAKAHESFERVSTATGAHWADLLHASYILDSWGEVELADQTHALAIERMKTAGIEASRLESAIWLGLMRPFIARVGRPALARGDAATVHRLQSRIYDAFPRTEYAPGVWNAVAVWMTSHGRTDLGAVWRDRATAILDAPGLTPDPGALDRGLPVLVGALAALVFAALTFGMRLGGSGPRVRDGVALLLPFAVAVIAGGHRTRCLDRESLQIFVPTSLRDGEAAPDGARFAATLPASPHRERVSAWIEAELTALRDGQPVPQPRLSSQEVRDAITPSMAAGINEFMNPAARAHPLIDDQNKHDSMRWLSRMVMIAALVVLLIGWAVGHFVGRGAARVSYAFPGGPTELLGLSSMFAAVPFGVICAIVIELKHPVFNAFVRRTPRWYGLEDLDATVHPSSARIVALCALAALAILLHVWAARRSIRRFSALVKDRDRPDERSNAGS